MPPPRSLTWRLVGWVLPMLLVLVGLLLVAISLTGTDEPDDIAAPPNVRDVTRINAPGWAQAQMPAGATSEVIGVVMVSSDETAPRHYMVRAVIGRVDSPAAPADPNQTLPDEALSTVATCVLWDVDVSTGAIVEHGAVELRREAGRHDMGDAEQLEARCAASTLPP